VLFSPAGIPTNRLGLAYVAEYQVAHCQDGPTVWLQAAGCWWRDYRGHDYRHGESPHKRGCPEKVSNPAEDGLADYNGKGRAYYDYIPRRKRWQRQGQ
jgi:hypothetical protein